MPDCVNMFPTFLRIVLFLYLFMTSGQSEHRLELVQVIMRHGQRTPLLREIYSKDIYNESSYEPWGLGQLTNDGKMTEYRIGTMLRERYDEFLGPIYHPHDVYAFSTNIDRTKISLQLTLAGLYPPAASQRWNSDLHWTPIPTHYMPDGVNMLLKPYRCPAYQAAVEEVRKMKEIHDKVAVYDDFFKFLKEKTGLNITDSEFSHQLYGLLMVQKCLNMTLPEWYTDEVNQTLQNLVILEYNIRSYTTELKRLNGGMLIKKFIENMNVNGERSNPRKIYVYSGHEVNIAAFAKSHNISEPLIPDYGSAFIFEKLRDEAGNLYVRILFWTGVTENLITIQLAGCDEICPLKSYLELVWDVIPSDEEMTCLWDNITREELLQLFVERIYLN